MNLIPKMHGATSIWIAGMILGIGSTKHPGFIWLIALMASFLMLVTVQGAHLKFFEDRNFHPVAIISPLLMIALFILSELTRFILLVYAPLLILVYLVRRNFRLYVIIGSILLTLPYPLMASTGSQLWDFSLYWGLFVTLSLWGVLLADQKIFKSSALPGLVVLVIYTLLGVHGLGIRSIILIPVPLAMAFIASIKNLRTKILGLALLSVELYFSIAVILISGFLERMF